MATIKQATSAILETAVIIPLATAQVARSIATSGVSTIEKLGKVTDTSLNSIIMGTKIAESEMGLILNRTISENSAILKVESEYYTTKDFKDKIKTQAMARFADDETDLTL